MPVLSKGQQLSTVLPGQFASSQNTNGPTTVPLQNKGGLHQNGVMTGRLLGCLHAARRRSPRLLTSWSHPPPQDLRQLD